MQGAFDAWGIRCKGHRRRHWHPHQCPHGSARLLVAASTSQLGSALHAGAYSFGSPRKAQDAPVTSNPSGLSRHAKLHTLQGMAACAENCATRGASRCSPPTTVLVDVRLPDAAAALHTASPVKSQTNVECVALTIRECTSDRSPCIDYVAPHSSSSSAGTRCLLTRTWAAQCCIPAPRPDHLAVQD